jgi:hypothetical protein
MPKVSGRAREEHEALRMMASGANTALEGLLNLDNIVYQKKAKAAVTSKELRKKRVLENWQGKFNLSLKVMLKLLNVFSTMERHPQFSPIKQQLAELIRKD